MSKMGDLDMKYRDKIGDKVMDELIELLSKKKQELNFSTTHHTPDSRVKRNLILDQAYDFLVSKKIEISKEDVKNIVYLTI